MLYTVTWTIELDAATPRQAAERALTVQRDRTSTATIFDVVSEQGGHALVDLLNTPNRHNLQLARLIQAGRQKPLWATSSQPPLPDTRQHLQAAGTPS